MIHSVSAEKSLYRRSATLLKETQVFSCEFCEIFKNYYFEEGLQLYFSTY